MSANTLALTLAYVGSVFGVVMVAPQIVRTVRHPLMRGVAPMSWALTALACSTWLIYGVRTGSAPQIPGNVLLVSGAVAIVLLVPSEWSRRRRALGLAAAAAVLVAVSFSVAPETVGFLAFGVGLTSLWPQVWESVITNRGSSAAGVSLPSFALKVLSQLCWLSFALLSRDIPVVISASTAVAATLVIIGFETARRTEPALAEAMVLEPV